MKRTFLVAVAVAALARPAGAGGEAARASPPPRENASYVPSDRDDVRKALDAAGKAAAAKDWTGEVRALQRIVEAAPDAVLPVSENRVFEGAFVVAHHRVVRDGRGAFDAYEREYGARARDALASAASGRDEARIAAVVDAWLPSEAGRRAALLLADLAAERGDVDAALGWLERIEDLEDVASPDLAAEVAAWRAARLDRASRARATSPEAVPKVRAWLEGPAGAPPPSGAVRRAPAPTDWTTTGGDASRTAIAPPLGDTLSLLWREDVLIAADDVKAVDQRPSPWLPPRAVVRGDRLYAFDGAYLHVFDLATEGKRVTDAIPVTPDVATAFDDGVRSIDARERFGLIEGHALTVGDDLVYCAWTEPLRGPVEGGEGSDVGGRDRVVAIRVDGRKGTRVWEVGGGAERPGLPEGLRLFGAPLLYRGALFEAGVRQTSSGDRFESWLVALDPETGDVLRATYLGAGNPVQNGRVDEIVPTSCAAAHGRVLVVTALGIASAVDATSGRTLWSYRYDRGCPDSDAQELRLEDGARQGQRRSTFFNEPPLVCAGRCFLAPTDSRMLAAVADRPRGRERRLELWKDERTDAFRDMAAEQLVAATDGLDGSPALLIVAGQGYPAPGEIPTCVAALDAATGWIRWDRALPSGEAPEPYGRAAVTAAEVYVSTEAGIARFASADGADRGFLDATKIPEARRPRGREKPWGNLVVVPGRGLVAVSEKEVSFWAAGPRR